MCAIVQRSGTLSNDVIGVWRADPPFMIGLQMIGVALILVVGLGFSAVGGPSAGLLR